MIIGCILEFLHCFGNNLTYSITIELGHRDFVRSLTLKSTPEAFQKIISGDFGGFVKVWEMENILKQVHSHMMQALKKGSYKPLEYIEYRSLCPHRGHITCVQCDQTKIVSGSRDKYVAINDFSYSNIVERFVDKMIEHHPCIRQTNK